MKYKYPDINFTDSSFSYYNTALNIWFAPDGADSTEVNEAWDSVFDYHKKDKLPSKYVGLVLNYIFLKAKEDFKESQEREQKLTWEIREQNFEIEELQEKIKELQEELKKAKQFKLNFN